MDEMTGLACSDIPAPESLAAVASFRTWWAKCRADALSSDNACGVARPATDGRAGSSSREGCWRGSAVQLKQMGVAAPPATLRHPSHLLPLLPSGPGGVHKLSSRRHQRSRHRLADSSSRRVAKESGGERAGCTRHFLCLALARLLKYYLRCHCCVKSRLKMLIYSV